MRGVIDGSEDSKYVKDGGVNKRLLNQDSYDERTSLWTLPRDNEYPFF